MYLVIGGNGFLGSYIIKTILESTDESVVATYRNSTPFTEDSRVNWVSCDITEEDAFDELIASISHGDVKVIFLAAYHNPDLVAENPVLAWDINVTTLSKCVNKLGFAKKLFYASTDSVYGNSVDGYHFKETDQLKPENIYGRNKAAAEAIVRYYGFNVVRFPFLIDRSLLINKKHFFDVIYDEIQSGNPFELFVDSYRSSLGFRQAAEYLIRLCEMDSELPDIINICGDRDMSKYDVGIYIADKFGLDKELIKPISINDGNNIFKSKRATSTLMDNSLLKSILGIQKVEFSID